jgi:hypothetical protein
MSTSPQQEALTARIVAGIQAGNITQPMFDALQKATTSFQPQSVWAGNVAPLALLVKAGMLVTSPPDPQVEYKITPAGAAVLANHTIVPITSY